MALDCTSVVKVVRAWDIRYGGIMVVRVVKRFDSRVWFVCFVVGRDFVVGGDARLLIVRLLLRWMKARSQIISMLWAGGAYRFSLSSRLTLACFS